MKTIVFNTSPLIFLARLGWLKDFVQSQENYHCLPQAVAVEIQAKADQACMAFDDKSIKVVVGIILKH